MSRTLLIDADIIAYQCSASNEQRIDWGDGVTSLAADFDAAKKAARESIDRLMAALHAASVIVCLSDDFSNFRKDFYPAYKTNRAASVRPEHLYDMKEWLAESYPTQLRARLEADDVMGILSTEPHTGERIIVSEDKDMQTVPGLLFNPNKDKKVRSITPEAATRFMLWQAICGDQTDGYPGCPGAGPAAAERLLQCEGSIAYQHVLRSGPRKGEEEVRWKPHTFDTPWAAIVAAYEKVGLAEADAVIQVNLAHILKHGDMDGNRVIPWSPEGAN